MLQKKIVSRWKITDWKGLLAKKFLAIAWRTPYSKIVHFQELFILHCLFDTSFSIYMI